jgi:hypothetical protein
MSVVTREELYELVWSTPMIRGAEKFEVSGSYLARVCTELRGPRPERGYWAKLAVGKAPQRPALPGPLLVELVLPYAPEGKKGRPPFAVHTMLRITSCSSGSR